jgi:hypothetical protein
VTVDWALVVELVKAIAWPITAAYALKKYAPIIKKLKIGENEIELRDVPEPKKLEESSTRALPEGERKALPAPTMLRDLAPYTDIALIEYAPTGAIISAWARLEEVMEREARRLGLVKDGERLRASDLARRLLGAEIITPQYPRILDQLRMLRNRVAHEGAAVSHEAAERYVESVDDLIRVIEMNADALRARQLCEQLEVSRPGELRVGMLNALGGGPTRESAIETLRKLWGRWLASSKSRSIEVEPRDALALLQAGAEYSLDPSRMLTK